MLQDFLGKTRKNYNAELESVDFKANSEAARLNINGWVEKQTQGESYKVTLVCPASSNAIAKKK